MPQPRDGLSSFDHSVDQHVDPQVIIKRDEQGRIVQVIEPCQSRWETKTYALDELCFSGDEPPGNEPADNEPGG